MVTVLAPFGMNHQNGEVLIGKLVRFFLLFGFENSAQLRDMLDRN